MDQKLLNAAINGDHDIVQQLELEWLLDQKTGYDNTCLHIACIHGHENFCMRLLQREDGLPHRTVTNVLLSAVNKDEQTPLLAAVASGHGALAAALLRCCCERRLQEDDNGAVLRRDFNGDNVLHHAIRGGHKELALDLITRAPALSRHDNVHRESPMFIAVLKEGFQDVFMTLLDIEGSSASGVNGYNALHAAVKYGDEEIVTMIMLNRPGMARELDRYNETPMHLAAHFNRDELVTRMLGRDPSLGYKIPDVEGVHEDVPPLVIAAERGSVRFARQLLAHCPDAPYRIERDENGVLEDFSKRRKGQTCLHQAVKKNQMEFVEFILSDKRLRRIINMKDEDGNTALHFAVLNCNSNMVSALQHHDDKSSIKMDVTVHNKDACAAVWRLSESKNLVKTISWNKISDLIYAADRRAKNDIRNLLEEIKNKVIDDTRKEVKSLSEIYTTNTSIVAILIATITFTAAFTLPGGYNGNDGSDLGLANMARKHAYAFQAFLISDTLAMGSSFAVAFICVIARWTDLQFLINYRSVTKNLICFAYMATTLAFASGLYVVLAPHLLWLAIVVCVISALSPIFTVLLFREWIILHLKIRRHEGLNSDFLKMV